MSSSSSSSQPLLHSSQPVSLSDSSQERKTIYTTSLQKAQLFLSSRYQHYVVLSLVTLDLLGIFADIIINLYQCDGGDTDPKWNDVREGLGIAGLVFSCLFLSELILSVWVFGLRYFSSNFHILDSLVILLGFTIDVLLHGIVGEVASLVVILRLWRFFKIIEEFSVGAQETMDALEVRIEQLEEENDRLRREVRGLKGGLSADDDAENGRRRVVGRAEV